VLKFGGNPSNAIPFVWVGGAKKLLPGSESQPGSYRRSGWGDSGNGAVVGRASFIHQMFTNVPLAFPATSAGAPMVVDLELGMDLPGGRASRSSPRACARIGKAR
jgi:hypothetical protein